MTSQVKIECTHHLSDPEVQPGKLDIVLVPGPDPRLSWDKPVTDWLAGHGAQKETDILSVCTGIYLCGEAGLLRGKRVCGPRGLQKQLKAKFDGVEWLGDELRWLQDGNLWSSGTLHPKLQQKLSVTTHDGKVDKEELLQAALQTGTTSFLHISERAPGSLARLPNSLSL